MIAAHAAPGGGKSRFLDLLCSLCGPRTGLSSAAKRVWRAFEEANHSSPYLQAFRREMEQCLAISITFNDFQDAIETRELRPSAALALRVIHRSLSLLIVRSVCFVGCIDVMLCALVFADSACFVGSEGVDWNSFVERFSPASLASLKLEDAIAFVRAASLLTPTTASVSAAAAASTISPSSSATASAVPLLLAVDELIKSHAQPELVSARLCSVLSRDIHFQTVVSTLRITANSANADLTGSGRKIQWLCLPPLSPDLAKQLFPTMHPTHPQTFDLLLADCAGHPRWLEALKAALDQVVQPSVRSERTISASPHSHLPLSFCCSRSESNRNLALARLSAE
jgi:hypothetical protein